MLRLLLTLAAVVLVVACSGREPLGESEYLVWCADFADRQADRIGVTPWSVEVTEGMVAEAFAEYNAHVSEDVGQLPVLLRLALEHWSSGAELAGMRGEEWVDSYQSRAMLEAVSERCEYRLRYVKGQSSG